VSSAISDPIQATISVTKIPPANKQVAMLLTIEYEFQQGLLTLKAGATKR
jgi:hypothetical protein